MKKRKTGAVVSPGKVMTSAIAKQMTNAISLNRQSVPRPSGNKVLENQNFNFQQSNKLRMAEEELEKKFKQLKQVKAILKEQAKLSRDQISYLTKYFASLEFFKQLVAQ
jgi:hypothetical protein